MSPSSSEPAFLARVAFTLVSWCLSYFALHLVFIARVAYNLFSWLVPPLSCFHGVCHLKVSGISSFKRVQTSFYNVLCPHFLFSSRVSLLGFLSLYSAYSFQAGLFMVFSAPNLVFVACVTFCLVFGIFCSYLFSMSLLPFGIVFHGVLLLLSSCAARHFGLAFHIFYTLISWSVNFL